MFSLTEFTAKWFSDLGIGEILKSVLGFLERS